MNGIAIAPPDHPSEETRSLPAPKHSRQAFAARRFRHRSELTRDRDVLRLVQTWDEQYKPRHLHRSPFRSNATHPVPTPCPDTALTAFAQLAALRMRVARCLITLTCASTEWVLTDACQRTTLQHSAKAGEPDARPWLGTCSFPRADSPSDEALSEWSKARCARDSPAEDDYYYTEGLSEHSFIISDLRHDRKHESLGMLRHGTWIRFYCSVPLRDAMGSVLGSFTVLDDKPRYGISANEMTLLEDLSDTVVQHLSATVARARRHRGERLISSLGLFHSGEDSLREWWLAHDDIRVLNTGRNVDKGTALERQVRVDVEFGSDSNMDQSGIDRLAKSEANGQALSDYFGEFSSDSSTDDSIVQSPINDVGESGRASRQNDRSVPALDSEKGGNDGKEATDGTSEGGSGHDLAYLTTATFRRASNLLREALGADGVAFVDATKVTMPLHNTSNNFDHHALDSLINGESNAKDPSDGEGSDSNSERSQMCKVQGISIRTSSASVDQASQFDRVNVPESFLQWLLTRSPTGFVCYFDHEGTVYSTSDESSSQSSSDEIRSAKHRRKKEYSKLGKIFRGAKVLSVYPLWDDGYSRWRSCVFVWSTYQGRCLDQGEDLLYLKAFGNSILAELSRLESIAADASKSTFISSISHELRSPLHGILAGVEFLHDTPLTDFQLEMTHAINMAGRTLLDTVTHVLDYSKIAGSLTRVHGAVKSKLAASRVNAINPVVHTDLARLTEEVVESTVTAHRLHDRAHRTSTSDHETDTPLSLVGGTSTPPARPRVDISMSLNITHRENWIVATQPGAWTRILTNLVGNAIKYTIDGHVSIRLSVGESIGPGPQGTERCPVQLSIEDTGIGMSETFLAHGLYTPFRQEHPHVNGTGLGMSIVKQITNSMGADLEIDSRLGKGTRAHIRFVANFVTATDASDTTFIKDSLPEWTSNLKVDELQLLPGPAPVASYESSSAMEADAVLSDSVLENAQEWLGCEIVKNASVRNQNGKSLCGITEQSLVAWQTQDPDELRRLLESVASSHSHLFILGRSMQSVTLSTVCMDFPVSVVYLHQPIGPRKLLRAIASDRDSTVSGDQRAASSSSPLRGGPSQVSTNMPQGLLSGRRLSSKDCNTSLSVESSKSHGILRASATSSVTSGDVTAPSTTNLSYLATPSSGIAEGTTSSNSNENFFRGSNGHEIQQYRNTILLVEDNEINMKLLIALISKLKIPYHCAVNGLEAVQAYTCNPGSFFLVLMDMSMPVMDGFTATAKIRQEEKRRKLKRSIIVAVTGVTDAVERQRAFDCGVDDFYTKPVSMRGLRDLVDGRR